MQLDMETVPCYGNGFIKGGYLLIKNSAFHVDLGLRQRGQEKKTP